MNFKMRQLFAVARHEFLNQFNSFSYWMMFVIPLIVVTALFKYVNLKFNFNNSNFINMVWGFSIPVLTFFFCLIYIGIIANSVARDKTSKLSEMLMSIVDAKEQINGKMLGIYLLLCFQIAFYTIFILILSKVMNNNFLFLFIGRVKIGLIVYSILALFVSLFMFLAITVQFSCFITDTSQISSATMPPMIFLLEFFSLSLLYNSVGFDGDNMIWIFYIICMWPPVGSTLTPSLIASGNISYLFAYSTLIIQIMIMYILYVKSIHVFKYGLLSNKKKNIFIEGFKFR
ncbi:ABC transporter permease family protein [Apilactobacillus timberlakei]|uniref:hypothetical protein n=1 Tax=Apilactobacillus timberlakei TaxID=2008380 RepID=UPI001128A17A|nr:hypothetical protein [Apilactobacillus timberlakei]